MVQMLAPYAKIASGLVSTQVNLTPVLPGLGELGKEQNHHFASTLAQRTDATLSHGTADIVHGINNNDYTYNIGLSDAPHTLGMLRSVIALISC